MGCYAIQTKECKGNLSKDNEFNIPWSNMQKHLIFHDLICKNMGVYINDVVVKSANFLQHLADLE